MIFEILTLFPGMFVSPLGESILGKARERGLVQVRVHNIRDHATDKHQITDDRPFGGGEGMVYKFYSRSNDEGLRPQLVLTFSK